MDEEYTELLTVTEVLDYFDGEMTRQRIYRYGEDAWLPWRRKPKRYARRRYTAKDLVGFDFIFEIMAATGNRTAVRMALEWYGALDNEAPSVEHLLFKIDNGPPEKVELFAISDYEPEKKKKLFQERGPLLVINFFGISYRCYWYFRFRNKNYWPTKEQIADMFISAEEVEKLGIRPLDLSKRA